MNAFFRGIIIAVFLRDDYRVQKENAVLLNVGIIGLGEMGTLHLMNCLHIDGIEVLAVADASKRSLNRAKSVGVNHRYVDYRDLFKQSNNLDSVVIALPNFLHLESVQLALEAGLDVFVEKPMAKTAKECQRIVSLVERNGRKLMIGHNLRFLHAIERMKDAADKGHMGNLEVVTLEMITNGPFAHPAVPKPVPDWWFDPKKIGGGALLDTGSHLLDLFRFFAGDSRILYSCLDHRLNLPIEDSAIVILSSSNSSAKGIVNVGWFQRSVFPKLNFRLILHGNAGLMSSDDLMPSNIYLHAVKEGTKNFCRRLIGRNIRPLSYTTIYESYYKELKYFFDCINQDSDISIGASARDGLKTIELIEEAYKNDLTRDDMDG